MKIIEFLQQFSNPVLDWFMRIITEFGDIYFYLAVGVVFYWIIDKKFGFKLMVALLFSMTINGFIKFFTNKNRPYQDGAKAILQKTVGSSMPSGHSQGIFSMGMIVKEQYKGVNWLKYVIFSLMVLVPLSRMYLGQHYLEDVIAGSILGVILGLLGIYLLEVGNKDVEDIRAFYLIPIMVLFMIITDDNQIYLATGAYTGLTVGYFLEKRYVNYDIKDSLKVNVFKLLIGVSVMLLLKEGLKPLLKLFISNENILDLIRYSLVTFWASFGAMAVFKLLFKKESKEEVLLKTN